MRGVARRPWPALAISLVVVLALIADVSGRRVADGYALNVSLSGWALIAAAGALGGLWLARWRREWRRRALADDAGPELAGAEDDREAWSVIGRDGTADARTADTPVQRIAVRSPRAIKLVAVDGISYVEAAGRYARIHAAGRQHLAQHSLAELERMLDRTRFVRVHRSTIVNAERVRSLRTVDYRDFELILDDGATVRLSRNYRERLEAALGLRI